MHKLILIVAVVSAACRLAPLVDDDPGASVNILPFGSTVPPVTDNAELVNQISLNDGLDDRVLVANEGIVPRGTGVSAGADVRYWLFGASRTAPAPIYFFFRNVGTEQAPVLERLEDHPPLVESLPGDPNYNTLHNIQNVIVTEEYGGQLFTTLAALTDATELGLVLTPAPAGKFVHAPIIPPGTKIDVGGERGNAAPIQAYARGYIVDMVQFGGDRGIQPGGALLPTSQISFLREDTKAVFDASRPIFQAVIPTSVPQSGVASYTPLSVVVNVDLAPGVVASDIRDDSQLFTRNAMGAISGLSQMVKAHTITTTALVLQLQFMDGEL